MKTLDVNYSKMGATIIQELIDQLIISISFQAKTLNVGWFKL